MNTILDLKNVKAGETVSRDFVYIKEYAERTYAEGTKSFIVGTFSNQGTVLSFKVWDANLVNMFKEYELSDMIVGVSGAVKEYKGVLELNVQAVDLKPECTDKSLFVKSVNVEGVFEKFANFLNTNISQNGVGVVMSIFQGESLFDRFKTEYAGSKMHDAQIGGLMNHEYKMLNIAKAVIDNDERLSGNTMLKDLIYIGIVCHDIGKVLELHNGQYTDNSFVSHIVFSIEMVSKYKGVIVKYYNENFYYQLIAIIQGHHGQWGDAPKTPFAYIVHLIDMLESQTTFTLDAYESGGTFKTSNGSQLIRKDDWVMTYPIDEIMNYKG